MTRGASVSIPATNHQQIGAHNNGALYLRISLFYLWQKDWFINFSHEGFHQIKYFLGSWLLVPTTPSRTDRVQVGLRILRIPWLPQTGRLDNIRKVPSPVPHLPWYPGTGRGQTGGNQSCYKAHFSPSTEHFAECENFALKRFNMYRKDLYSVPAEVLVKVISSMETVDLRFALLTPVQINNIFTLVAERKSSKLRKVHFWKNDISSVTEVLRERALENTSVLLTFKAEIK